MWKEAREACSDVLTSAKAWSWRARWEEHQKERTETKEEKEGCQRSAAWSDELQCYASYWSRAGSDSLNKLSGIPNVRASQMQSVCVNHCSSVLKYYGKYEWTPEKAIKDYFSCTDGQFESKKKNMHCKSVFSELFYVICQEKLDVIWWVQSRTIFLHVTWCKQGNVKPSINIQITLAARSLKTFWRGFIPQIPSSCTSRS